MKIERIVLLLVLSVPFLGILCMSAAGGIPQAEAPVIPYTCPPDGLECVTQPDPGEPTKTFASFPLIFIKNAGQLHDDILFMVFSDAGPVSFGNDGAELILTSAEMKENVVFGYRFEGIAGDAAVEGVDKLACEANFFYGKDPSQWVTGVDTYRALRYVDLYPGIDLLYEGVSDGLKSTYFVRPGADPGLITIEYYGHDEISIADDGTLVLSNPAGTITHSAPYCYQVIDGSVVGVSCDYTINDQGYVGFAVEDYDREHDLIIDPVLQYSLYLKGVGMYDANGVALDSGRNAYVTGVTYETPYVVPGRKHRGQCRRDRRRRGQDQLRRDRPRIYSLSRRNGR